MSFDKKYPKSKDARRRMHRYHDSRDFDRGCRTGGNCDYCKNRRTYQGRKAKAASDERMKETGE